MNANKNRVRALLLLTVLLHAAPTWAGHAIGWHWYNEIQLVKRKKESKTTSKATKPVSAIAQMSLLRQVVREAKAKAILYPTEQNTRDYLMLQNLVTEKAIVFSQVWKKTLLDFPSLDYGVRHPTENNAQSILYAKENRHEQRAIDKLRKQYGLFFFYRGNNNLDKALAPTIATFSEQNKIALIGVSVDGKRLPVFEHNQIDHGYAKRLGIVYFPALLLVNPKTRQVRSLNYGFTSSDKLRQRFLAVATDFREGA